MTKKIAVINDLSGFGRCSLTAAISVIAAMGVQPCPLPTAVLSAQTGYPSYYCDDYTEKMEYFRSEWKKMGQTFDGIYTGFVASEQQIDQIFHFVETFDTPDTFLLVDPVMGDDGHTYAMFTPELLRKMKKLAMTADIITPNLTELTLLTDASYHELVAISDAESMMKEIVKLAQSLCEAGPSKVIVTGIRFSDNDGTRKMGNLYVTKEVQTLVAFPYIGGSYSGTGDLMASVIAGGKARGDSVEDTVELAGEMIARAIKDSVRDKVQRNEGVEYEKYLWMLTNLSLPERWM